MPDLDITSGEGGGDGQVKIYHLAGGSIQVTGKKDAGATVSVTLQPGGTPAAATQDAEDPTVWTILIPVAATGHFTINASTTSPNQKNISERIEVVSP